jgi:hypothetical protein
LTLTSWNLKEKGKKETFEQWILNFLCIEIKLLTKHIRIRNKNQQKKSITYLPSISIDETNHMLFEL